MKPGDVIAVSRTQPSLTVTLCHKVYASVRDSDGGACDLWHTMEDSYLALEEGVAPVMVPEAHIYAWIGRHAGLVSDIVGALEDVIALKIAFARKPVDEAKD